MLTYFLSIAVKMVIILFLISASAVLCVPVTDGSIENNACNLTAFPPDPSSLCCGVDATSNNINLGNVQTRMKQYPWLALVMGWNKDTGQSDLICSGFLISGRYVMTAAHCLLEANMPISVRLGVYDLARSGAYCMTINGVNECTVGSITVPIDKVILYPQYNPTTTVKWNDIALIRLKYMANYTDEIRPICLPSSDLRGKSRKNLRVYAAGWWLMNQGSNPVRRGLARTIKRHVDLPYNKIEKCFNSERTLDDRRQICAGGEEGKASCNGDSGGPLMHANNGMFNAIGIVSFGSTPCGKRNTSTVYTKVYAYKDWITNQINTDEMVNRVATIRDTIKSLAVTNVVDVVKQSFRKIG